MRRGSAIPLVLIVLLLAVTLGTTFYFTSRGGYRATAQAAYRLRLQLFLVSALDEARTRLFQMTTPGAQSIVLEGPVLKQLLLDRIPVPSITGKLDDPDPYAAPPDLSQVDFERSIESFDGKDLLWASKAIAFVDVPNNPPEYMGRIELVEAKVRLHGFRRVAYDDEAKFPDGFDYYQGILPFTDPLIWHRDYVGYATVTIHARLKSSTMNLERKIQVTHDVKVVDSRPPARNFALFAYRSTFGHERRALMSLNENGDNGQVTSQSEFDPANPPGGRLIMYPQAMGRIYIRGPYVYLTESRGTNGLGGDKPLDGPGYPQGGYTNWGGISTVPGPRGVTLPAKLAIGNWPSPVRPQQSCSDNGSYIVSAPLLGSPFKLAANDPAGFGVTTYIAAAPLGPNRQRFYLTGESQCFGLNDQSCRPDSFRGLLQHRPDIVKDKPEGFPLLERWQPLPPDDVLDPNATRNDQAWTMDGLEKYDQIRVESGAGIFGLYSVYKMYPFVSDRPCPKEGFLQRAGGWINSAGAFIASVGTAGALTFAAYSRNPPRDPSGGLAGEFDEARMREVAAQKYGLSAAPQAPEGATDSEYEEFFATSDPFLAVLPFGFHYQKPETLGWASTLFSFAIEVVGLAAMILLPGPGILINAGLKTASRIGVRAATRTITHLQGSWAKTALVDAAEAMLIQAPALSKLAETVLPEGDSTIGDNSNLGGPPVSSLTQEQILANQDLDQLDDPGVVTGESTGGAGDVAEDFANQIGSFKQMMDAFVPHGRNWDEASEALGSMMTGNPPKNAAASLQNLRAEETFGDPNVRQVEDVYYLGFLPPGLKPLQRLATKWYPTIQEAVDPTDGTLNLEGVLSFDRFPQEGEPTFNLRYAGKGMIVSGADDKTDGPNQKPTFGTVEPVDQSVDYMTMMFWSQLAPDQAVGQTGSGMLSLRGDTWATVVANYGARPLTADTAIRGNLVTGFLDRNRFPNNANLRVFYRWDMLRPDLPEQIKAEIDAKIANPNAAPEAVPLPANSVLLEEQIRPWQSVTISPKVAGWHDSVQ